MDENKKPIVENELESISGGSAGKSNNINFRLSVTKGHLTKSYPYTGTYHQTVQELKEFISSYHNAELSKIRIYMPDRSEINYQTTLGENKVIPGNVLHVRIITE